LSRNSRLGVERRTNTVERAERKKLEFSGSENRGSATTSLVGIETLVRQAHREIHAAELVGYGGPLQLGDAGPMLDASARREYDRRLEDLATIVIRAAPTHRGPTVS
jgi:hypothetical protein